MAWGVDSSVPCESPRAHFTPRRLTADSQVIPTLRCWRYGDPDGAVRSRNPLGHQRTPPLCTCHHTGLSTLAVCSHSSSLQRPAPSVLEPPASGLPQSRCARCAGCGRWLHPHPTPFHYVTSWSHCLTFPIQGVDTNLSTPQVAGRPLLSRMQRKHQSPTEPISEGGGARPQGSRTGCPPSVSHANPQGLQCQAPSRQRTGPRAAVPDLRVHSRHPLA